MEIAYFVFFIVVACFSIVLVYGAPYLPTHKKQIQLSLDYLNLKKGQTMYELGCGDGRVLREAAKMGYNAVGYEMNPIMYLVSRLNTWGFRKQVKVKFKNFWTADLSGADGVYVFLLDKFMPKLDIKLSKELRTGVRLTSYTFKIPEKKPLKVDSGIFVYKY